MSADGYVRADIGALPNSSTKSFPSNIPSQTTEYWIEAAWCRHRSTGQVNSIPHVDPVTWNNSIGITISAGKNIVVTTRADWTTYDGYVVIAYKT